MIENLNLYLFAAYTIVFTVLFAYLVLLHRRQSELKQRVDRLEQDKHD
ncbi:MAG: CcmD family protein [Acidobacteriota bacterium]